MEAEDFHDGFAAELGFHAEQVLERAVGEINLAAAVQQQQSFEHGIEQHLLLRFCVNGRLLLPALNIFEVRARLNLLLAKSRAPPEMNSDGGNNGENG